MLNHKRYSTLKSNNNKPSIQLINITLNPEKNMIELIFDLNPIFNN